MNENKWSFKRALVNSFKWDSSDWIYIKTHIVWLLIILLLSFLYYSEVKTARHFINDPCVDKCLMERYIEDFKSKNPDVQLICDYKIKSCTYFGVLDDENLEELKKLNFTLEKDDG